MVELREKKILQFGAFPQNTTFIKGGIESSVYGLCMELSKQKNIKIKVLNYPKRGITKDYKVMLKNLEIVYFSNPFHYDALSPLCLYKLVKEVRRFKPDVCHLHGTFFNVLILLIYLKFKRIKSVITVHGILSVEQRHIFEREKNLKSIFQLFLYSLVELAILNITKEIIVDTCYVRDWTCQQKLIVRKPKIHVIPQGIDQIFFSIPDNSKPQHLVSVGSLSRRKGYEYSIRAVKELTGKFPELKYHIVGMLYDEKYYDELKDLIYKLRLENNVFILPDLSKTEVYRYLSEGNVFLLHSQEESQGIVFCEAMAAGKPIVATNVGGIPDVVKDKHNGYLSPYGNINSFYSNIETILSSVELQKQMSRINRADAKEYMWSAITYKITLLYNLN